MMIPQQGLLQKINQERTKYGAISIEQADLDRSLEELKKLKCIKAENGNWKLTDEIWIPD